VIDRLDALYKAPILRASKRKIWKGVEVDMEHLLALITVADVALDFYEQHRAPQYVALKEALDYLDRVTQPRG
jgi:hypothetical protein